MSFLKQTITSRTHTPSEPMDAGKVPFFQPKSRLAVNTPDDALEREADEMGERAIRGEMVQRIPQHGRQCACPQCGAAPAVQRFAEERTVSDQNEEAIEAEPEIAAANADEAEAPEEEVSFQTKPAQVSPTNTLSAPPGFAQALAHTKGSGSPLPPQTRAQMEQTIGADFSQVRLHTDEKAAQMSDSVQAQAFTHGQDIYFNAGKYQPNTLSGKRLLAHELTHVTQQSQGNIVRRFIGKVWKGIKKGAKWVGNKIKKGVKAIGKGAKWLGSKIGKGVKWLGGQLISKIAGIFHRIGRWITQLPARVGRLLSGLLDGLKSFKPWTLSWWKSLGKLDTWKNFLKWVGARLIDMLEIMGIGEVYETLMDFIKFNTRPLNEAERTAASRIFGTSINLDLVRVDERAIIGPAFSGRAYTSFHTINSWGREPLDVMMHELTHVWQYETAGAIYMPQAIHAQVWGEGYTYNGAQGLQDAKSAGKNFHSFNREQQGQIIQNFYNLKTTGDTQDRNNPANSTDLPLYAEFVQAVSTLSQAQLLASW